MDQRIYKMKKAKNFKLLGTSNKLVELNKEDLSKKIKVKLKPYLWKRVVLDKSKEGKNQVAKQDLKGLEARWKGK